MTRFTRRRAERAVAGAAAAAVWSLTAGMSIFSAAPIYNPLRAEFAWSPWSLLAAASLSLSASVAVLVGGLRTASLPSTRALCTTPALAAGAVLLLFLPNLTHLWQLLCSLLLLGILRGTVALGCWRELLKLTGARLAGLLIATATAGGFALWTPVIANVVFRNSWREGAAAAGGAMLLLATPLAYLLLPGSD